ncbi:hypothetical protein NTE_01561 [Candidatus Nitrososphaera evergladensis SR1]|uniref:Uncharacterized protein n=1 Tax=Candidatus Nitrososphaera evergladensis SR1 TaxID=1459636 RepID=A0A075MWH1_9ARCH|nr:hypothetical protein [Candidatus Nitrososphaera evergladensis]AIF83624.1 hypothetical protein NTE_01561 [Candidatus Nitrososphaera evergladensis SR1]
MQAKYLVTGIALVAVGGGLALFLNFQGYSCLSQLARIDRSTYPPAALDELERNCFIVTNSYVYSLFAVVAGAIVLAVGYKKSKSDNP